MKAQIAAATAVLLGKPLWTCRRAGDMATFQFGERKKALDFYARPSEVGEYALHVQCAWRITCGDELVVGSRDLYYPADYHDTREDLPPEFDWDRDPNRRDKLLDSLFGNGTREFVVQRIEAGAAGSLHIALSDGYSLDVFPYDSLGGEHWRLFIPGKDEPHFVVTGRGIET
ncbi:MAG: hypothetical protein LAO04_18265 [Acidobacteriia bacterium]|nr:hypothetical protein [Terriglobia bacterium]